MTMIYLYNEIATYFGNTETYIIYSDNNSYTTNYTYI